VGEGVGVGVGSGVGDGLGLGEANCACASGTKPELDPVVEPTRIAWNPTTRPIDSVIIARLIASLPRRVGENSFFISFLDYAVAKIIHSNELERR
jgi:hypothetical protein